MPNTRWSELSSLQLGRYAEYYAKMEMTSYGFEVYTSEVDDHGIDFVVKKVGSTVYNEIQVKSVRDHGYVFLTKSKWDLKKDNLFLILVIFCERELPEVFLIPSDAWKTTNELFKDRDYKGKHSAPEYGLNISIKNKELLESYKLIEMIEHLK